MALTVLHVTDAAVRWLRAGGARARCAPTAGACTPGDAFIAWPGVRDDGRRYVAAALAAGAAHLPGRRRRRRARSASTTRASRRCRAEGAPPAPSPTPASSQPSRRARRGRDHRHQRQDLDRLVDRAGARALLGRRCGVDRHARRRRAAARTASRATAASHRPDHARPGDAAGRARATSPTPGFAGLRDRGLVDRPGRASPRAARASRWRCSPTSRATTSTTTATMPAYWAAKRTLFGWPGCARAVINIDDEQGAALADELAAAAGPTLWTYSRAAARALVRARPALRRRRPRRSTWYEGERRRCRCAATLIGDYNVSNLLAVIGGLRALRRRRSADAARVRADAVAGARAHAARRRRRRRRCPRWWSTTRTRPTRSSRRCRRCARWRSARRQAVVRVRLRRQPRRDQAAR